MNELINRMVGCKLPSFTGKVIYEVATVDSGQFVTLHSPNRKKLSVLPWADIERVYSKACGGIDITPKVVDGIRVGGWDMDYIVWEGNVENLGKTALRNTDVRMRVQYL